MKKMLSILLVLALSIGAFAACGDKTTEVPAEEPTTETPAETPAEEPAEEPAADDEFVYPGGVRTGLAVITSTAKSADAADDKEGNAQSDSVVAAVIVGEDGRIIDAVLDTAQNKIAFDKEGKLVTPMDTVFKSKRELGEDYGMKAASGIGKEWDEQAAEIEKYVIGKNIEELRGIALAENTAPAEGEDLAASVTIKIGGYVDAFVKAIETSQELGAAVEDKIGLGIETNMGHSANAEADKDGLAQAYSTYVATTVDATGKITSAIVDASQANINFDATGKITSDITEAVLTKNELGEDYGMKAASGIGKEWNEQAEAFAKYVTGKNIIEVKEMKIEEGTSENEDLKASVTIGVGDITKALDKAYADAFVSEAEAVVEDAVEAVVEEVKDAVEADKPAA